MKALSLPLAFALPLFLFAGDAQGASQSAYSMDILINGRVMTEYSASNHTYVEAFAGQEYVIRLQNRQDHRVGVALAVDGLNVIDAKRSSAQSAAKWVIPAHGTLYVRGWQTGGDRSRNFFFTSEEGSYGEWLGESDNLGIISAVFFDEEAPAWTWNQGVSGGSAEMRRDQTSRAQAAPEKKAKASLGSGAEMEDYAATGIGREQYNPVTRVELDLEDRPSASISLRYEFRRGLIDLGVLPSGNMGRREMATGFEAMEFAPDPYRR